MVSLVIFDLDGTLVESYTTNLLPGVKDFFRLVLQGRCPQPPSLAIATNQGGVGMRRWMEKAGFGEPEEYPTQAEVEQRLKSVVASLGDDQPLPFYVSYRYQTRQGRWSPLPEESRDDPRWQADWRKPQPGMLLQAMQDAGVIPQQTLYVGDSAADMQAAQAAGCAFQWAKDFFNRDWADCDHLAHLLS